MRPLFLVGLLLLLAVVPAAFFSGPVRSAVVGAALPFLQGRETVRDGIAGKLERLHPASVSERGRLRHYERLVQQLQLQLLNARNAMDENRELRIYYELATPPDWKLLAAPVIARDPITWNRRFRIGKGTAHGVMPGAAIMAGNQVIGRVMETTANSALVVTVADPTCRLSVRLQASNAIGILAGRVEQKWHEPPVCVINYLPRDYPYREGDYVVTSGLGGTVPPGLPVGRVTPWSDANVTHVVNSAYAQILARPGAAFNIFRYVAVVVPRGPLPESAAARDDDDAADDPPKR